MVALVTGAGSAAAEGEVTAVALVGDGLIAGVGILLVDGGVRRAGERESVPAPVGFQSEPASVTMFGSKRGGCSCSEVTAPPSAACG